MNRPSHTADVYISHTPQDQGVAERLSAALQKLGLRIGQHPTSSRLTCVIWSDTAAASAEVQADCAQARKSGFVLPLQIDRTEVPNGIGTLQTLHLDDMAGEWSDERLSVVRDEILRAVQGSRLWNDTSSVRQKKRHAHRAPVTSTLPAPGAGLAGAVRRFLVGAGALALLVWGALDLQERLSARNHRDTGVRLMLAAEPRPEDALRELNEAVRRRPDDALARYHLAQLRVMLGHMDDARESVTAALQGGSGLSPAQRIMAEQLLARLNAPEPLPRLGLSESRHDRTGTWAVDTAALLHTARAVPVPAAELQDARMLVQSLFDADPEQRLHAAGLLAATPDITSDALPLALSKAQALTRPGRETDIAAIHALSSTLHLALTASPLTIADQRKPLEALLAPIQAQRWGHHTAQQAEHLRTRLQQVASSQPVVRMVLTHSRQRAWADRLAAQMTRSGLSVVLVDRLDSPGPERTQVRPLGSSHQGLARWLQREAATASRDEATAVLPVRRGADGRDEYEVWIGRDVCAPPQDPPECRGR